MRVRLLVNVIIFSLFSNIVWSVIHNNETINATSSVLESKANKSWDLPNNVTNNETLLNDSSLLNSTITDKLPVQSNDNNVTSSTVNSTKRSSSTSGKTFVHRNLSIFNQNTSFGKRQYNSTAQTANESFTLNFKQNNSNDDKVFSVKDRENNSNIRSSNSRFIDNDTRGLTYGIPVHPVSSQYALQNLNNSNSENAKDITNTTLKLRNKSLTNTLDHVGAAINISKLSSVHFYQSTDKNDERAMFMVDPENKHGRSSYPSNNYEGTRTKHSSISLNLNKNVPSNDVLHNFIVAVPDITKSKAVRTKSVILPKISAINKLNNIKGRVRQIKEKIETSRKRYIKNALHQKESEILELKPSEEINLKPHINKRNKLKLRGKQSRLQKGDLLLPPLDESAMKRNKVQANRIYSVEDQPERQQANKKNVLIQQAADELKSVLSKKTMSSRTKSKLLTQIFDDKGDNEKAKVATEIFREALEPSNPTHGQVGDLGAEMIKVSLLARKKSHRPHKKSKSAAQKKKQAFPERLTGNFRKNKLDLSEYIPEMEENVTGDRKSKLKIDASNFGWDDPKTLKQRKKSSEKAKIKLTESTLNTAALIQELRKNLHTKPKNHSSLYMLLKKSANKINMKGRSAKLLSVKDIGNITKTKGNKSLKVPQSRKDLVIELDDDMNGGKDVRDIDPIMSLIRKFARTNQDDDIAIIDERDFDLGNSNEVDDGFLSSNRRRLGENLFMESFAENEPNIITDNEESSEVTGVQRSFLPPEESFIDDNYESKLESYFPLASLENTYFQPPAVYDQVQDEAAMLSPQKGSFRSLTNDPEILMEIDKRRRESIPDT